MLDETFWREGGGLESRQKLFQSCANKVASFISEQKESEKQKMDVSMQLWRLKAK